MRNFIAQNVVFYFYFSTSDNKSSYLLYFFYLSSLLVCLSFCLFVSLLLNETFISFTNTSGCVSVWLFSSSYLTNIDSLSLKHIHTHTHTHVRTHTHTRSHAHTLNVFFLFFIRTFDLLVLPHI